MENYLLMVAAIIIACVIFNKISGRLGIPMLLAFIVLGMVFGTDGLVHIPFDNYAFAGQLCSVALIFIIFYGGFGTGWSEARPVALKALLLSSLGTLATAALVGLFCCYVLKIAVLESFLIGAVISSTDAASVFSILRGKHLNLRGGTASLLELESGSNDPFSYMLTVIVLSLMNGGISGGALFYMVFAQLAYGAAFGTVISVLALVFLKKFKFASPGFDAIFVIAIALLAYAAPAALGGNGYLSVYITGIFLGNSKIPNKQPLVHFFDGATGLMQMLLFFILGLLSFPSRIPGMALTSLAIAVFLTFVARPLAVFAILFPFKSGFRQLLLVSWAGMRGAASIVFAIMVVTNPVNTENDIFHIVFFIVLFSILLQGSLIPLLARKLKMTDPDADVMKTFSDYVDEVPVHFLLCPVDETHPWAECRVCDITLPPESLLVLLIRGESKIVPNGQTLVNAGDQLILSGRASGKIDGVRIYEKQVGIKLNNKKISEISRSGNRRLIILIRRGENIIIPSGDTVLETGDILVINDPPEFDRPGENAIS